MKKLSCFLKVMAISLSLFLFNQMSYGAVVQPFFKFDPENRGGNGLGPQGLTPDTIQDAYGGGASSSPTRTRPQSGEGQIIAIITAFHHPNMASDFQGFKEKFNLGNAGCSTQPCCNNTSLPKGCLFVHSIPLGETAPLAPTFRLQNDWDIQTALTVEWASAWAPWATIVLIEAKSNKQKDMLAPANFRSRECQLNWSLPP